MQISKEVIKQPNPPEEVTQLVVDQEMRSVLSWRTNVPQYANILALRMPFSKDSEEALRSAYYKS